MHPGHAAARRDRASHAHAAVPGPEPEGAGPRVHCRAGEALPRPSVLREARERAAEALLVGDAASPLVTTLGIWLIWIAAGLTLITGYDYLRTGLRHMAEDAPPGSAE